MADKHQYAMLQRNGQFLVCCCGHMTFQIVQGPEGGVLAQCERCDAVHHPLLMPTRRIAIPAPLCPCDDVCIGEFTVRFSGMEDGCDQST